MKTEEHDSRVIRNGEFKESNFGVASKQDLVHIFNVLRNKMYTNKILAVLREYSTNAMDAHIESGSPNKPIEVSLPTENKPYLNIRDFGSGLSDNDIRNVYAMYGASTKRDSNDYNGQLGFGSKAAFSYTDSFTVTSFFGGRKTSYEAYIDETRLGAVAEVFSEDCGNETGILITVPVKKNDINSFKYTAVELYKYFLVTPKVANLNGSEIVKPTYSYEGKGWGLRNSGSYYNNGGVAIMGNVAYPIELSPLRSVAPPDSIKRINNMFNMSFDVFFDIGDLSIAATREGLEYDRKTVANIINKINEIFNVLKKEVESGFDECKDIIEARAKYKKISCGELNAFRKRCGITSFKWKGVEIASSEFRIPSEVHKEGFIAHKVFKDVTKVTGVSRKHMFGSKGSWDFHFSLDDAATIIINDAPDRWMRRCATLLEKEDYNRAVVVTFADDKLFEVFKKETLLDDHHFFHLKDYEPKALPKRTYVANAKSKGKAFQLGNIFSYKNALSEHWDPVDVDVDNESGVYVMINRYRGYINGKQYDPSQLSSIIDNLKCVGIDIREDLIGFKRAFVEKKVKDDPSWKTIEEVIIEALDSSFKDVDLLKASAFNLLSSKFNYHSIWTSILLETKFKNLPSKIVKQNSEMLEFIKLSEECTKIKKAKTKKLTLVKSLITIMGTKSNEVFEKHRKNIYGPMDELHNKVLKKYPLLSKMERWSIIEKDIADYINGMDAIK